MQSSSASIARNTASHSKEIHAVIDQITPSCEESACFAVFSHFAVDDQRHIVAVIYTISDRDYCVKLQDEHSGNIGSTKALVSEAREVLYQPLSNRFNDILLDRNPLTDKRICAALAAILQHSPGLGHVAIV